MSYLIDEKRSLARKKTCLKTMFFFGVALCICIFVCVLLAVSVLVDFTFFRVFKIVPDFFICQKRHISSSNMTCLRIVRLCCATHRFVRSVLLSITLRFVRFRSWKRHILNYRPDYIAFYYFPGSIVNTLSNDLIVIL